MTQPNPSLEAAQANCSAALDAAWALPPAERALALAPAVAALQRETDRLAPEDLEWEILALVGARATLAYFETLPARGRGLRAHARELPRKEAFR